MTDHEELQKAGYDVCWDKGMTVVADDNRYHQRRCRLQFGHAGHHIYTLASGLKQIYPVPHVEDNND